MTASNDSRINRVQAIPLPALSKGRADGWLAGRDEAQGAECSATGIGARGREAALAECDKRIGALECEIAEASEAAKGAETPRKVMDKPRRKDNEEHVGFELQLISARNVKTAHTLLTD